MKIRETLILGIKTLKNSNIEDYSLIARELLAFILKKDKHYLIVNSDIEISDILVNKYDKYLNEIIEGKPLQYITNKQEFMKLDFYVDESVLIPQPDTEILVEEVLKLCNEKDEIKILDLCTGSGAVAVSLGKYIKIKDKIIFASDISKNALKIAKKNAKNNKYDIVKTVKDLANNDRCIIARIKKLL